MIVRSFLWLIFPNFWDFRLLLLLFLKFLSWYNRLLSKRSIFFRFITWKTILIHIKRKIILSRRILVLLNFKNFQVVILLGGLVGRVFTLTQLSFFGIKYFFLFQNHSINLLLFINLSAFISLMIHLLFLSGSRGSEGSYMLKSGVVGCAQLGEVLLLNLKIHLVTDAISLYVRNVFKILGSVCESVRQSLKLFLFLNIWSYRFLHRSLSRMVLDWRWRVLLDELQDTRKCVLLHNEGMFKSL